MPLSHFSTLLIIFSTEIMRVLASTAFALYEIASIARSKSDKSGCNVSDAGFFLNFSLGITVVVSKQKYCETQEKERTCMIQVHQF